MQVFHLVLLLPNPFSFLELLLIAWEPRNQAFYAVELNTNKFNFVGYIFFIYMGAKKNYKNIWAKKII